MKPVVRITTSDTGSGGANIFPMLVSGKENTTISLGSPLKLGHRNGRSLSEFDDQLKLLYAAEEQEKAEEMKECLEDFASAQEKRAYIQGYADCVQVLYHMGL